jgi:hypothetical protein
MVGANGVSTKVPGAKKIIFSRVVPTSLGMLKQVFLARFKPVVTRFGPGKVPKCLENGPFWDQPKMGQKWVKNVFFQKRSWTVWSAQTSETCPFRDCFEPFRPL